MSNTRPTTDELGFGALTGVAAYFLGYAATHFWQAAAIRNRLVTFNAVAELFGGGGIPPWKAVGWLFYNAHLVPFTSPQNGASRDFIAGGDAPAFLYLLPPLLLVAGGFVLARVTNARSVLRGARAGVLVVAGYLVLAVAGLFVFRHTVGGTAVHPQYALGALVAGIVYPVVFGAFGGLLGGATTTT